MRFLPLISLGLGIMVVLSEVQWIGRTTLWIPILALSGAVIALAVAQLRHGG